MNSINAETVVSFDPINACLNLNFTSYDVVGSIGLEDYDVVHFPLGHELNDPYVAYQAIAPSGHDVVIFANTWSAYVFEPVTKDVTKHSTANERLVILDWGLNV